VAVPLVLTGSSNPVELLRVSNTAALGTGVFGGGGPGIGGAGAMQGGLGVVGSGGSGLTDTRGGDGVNGIGGDGLQGGTGLVANGGKGTRLDAANPGEGGHGVVADGGDASSGVGGDGVIATGGVATGAGSRGGIGITAIRGAGLNGATDGRAGEFFGDVAVTGTLSKGGGAFKIDHPLDPENKYLYHSFVESPDMMNIYNGNITTDASGEAVVTLPDWFDTLNRDFRYQLTVVGQFAQAIVGSEIHNNRFTIKTNVGNVKVSWQVTGIRQDAYANAHRIPVEEDKSARERGYYLHPDAFNQPEERGMQWAEHPEMMQQRKQRRLEADQYRERPRYSEQ